MKEIKKNVVKNRVIIALAGGAMLAGLSAAILPSSLHTKAEEQPVTFEMDDEYGVGLRLNGKGGMRFVVKMNETIKKEIVDDDEKNEVKLSFVIAPKALMPEENYLGMEKKILVNVEESKIFQVGDFWYANGCVEDILEANRKINYTAVALITKGEEVLYTAGLKENLYGNYYDIANRALLYSENHVDYAAAMLENTAYNWLGTDEYPIVVKTAKEYSALVEKVNDGIALENKVIHAYNYVDTSVKPEGKEFANLSAPTKAVALTANYPANAYGYDYKTKDTLTVLAKGKEITAGEDGKYALAYGTYDITVQSSVMKDVVLEKQTVNGDYSDQSVNFTAFGLIDDKGAIDEKGVTYGENGTVSWTGADNDYGTHRRFQNAVTASGEGFVLSFKTSVKGGALVGAPYIETDGYQYSLFTETKKTGGTRLILRAWNVNEKNSEAAWGMYNYDGFSADALPDGETTVTVVCKYFNNTKKRFAVKIGENGAKKLYDAWHINADGGKSEQPILYKDDAKAQVYSFGLAAAKNAAATFGDISYAIGNSYANDVWTKLNPTDIQ